MEYVVLLAFCPTTYLLFSLHIHHQKPYSMTKLQCFLFTKIDGVRDQVCSLLICFGEKAWPILHFPLVITAGRRCRTVWPSHHSILGSHWSMYGRPRFWELSVSSSYSVTTPYHLGRHILSGHSVTYAHSVEIWCWLLHFFLVKHG